MSTRPLPWLAPNFFSVDLFSTLGYQAVRAAINHVVLTWNDNRELDAVLYNYLIPNDYIFSVMNDQASLHSALLHPEILAFSILEPSSRPVSMMSPRDLSGWWAKKLNPSHQSSSDFRIVLDDPAFLIRAGYDLLRHQYPDICEDTPEIGACLSMIGAGALAVFVAQPCSLCRVRRRVHGTLRCKVCSRSKRVIDPINETPQAATTNKVKRLLKIGNFSDFSLPDDLQPSYSRSLASLLFSMPKQCQEYARWLSSIKTSLDKSPIIHKLLGPDFLENEFTYQAQNLRRIIDENEWDYALWPKKILQAQAWHDAAGIVRQRRRGPGPMAKTIDLAHRAQQLLKDGSSKTEVARTLGISLSHLSHILRRTSQVRQP